MFCPPKHFCFKNPGLSWKREGNKLIVIAGAYAKGVFIDCPDEDIELSDNFFDMNAGEKQIFIMRGNPEKVILKSVYDIGR
jgi:beta-mannosidase